MTEADIVRQLLDVLAGIAPEADLAAIDAALPLRDQIDLDSVDYFNFVAAIEAHFALVVPDSYFSAMGSLAEAARTIAAVVAAA